MAKSIMKNSLITIVLDSKVQAHLHISNLDEDERKWGEKCEKIVSPINYYNHT